MKDIMDYVARKTKNKKIHLNVLIEKLKLIQ